MRPEPVVEIVFGKSIMDRAGVSPVVVAEDTRFELVRV
jgi:hypothetical protein